jgi:repressor LexA
MKKYQNAIADYYRRNKRMPSFAEIMKITGLRSKNSVSKIVDKMVALNLVRKDSSGRLIPRKLFPGTKLLGTITAGFPSPAEEELADTITIDEYLIKNKEATYLLKITGDSMIDAGIRPGDMALVERHRTPRDGDIVIAEIDGNWTMKFFKKQGNKVFLMPGNKKYKPIIPQEELKISAIVIAVIRKY